jgi:hypothetical protein
MPILWPGARYTPADREAAIQRGIEFIYRTASDAETFTEYGYDLLWCFYTISATARSPKLRRVAREMGHERAVEWRRFHATVPPDSSPAEVADLVFGSDAADRLGVRDPAIKEQLRRFAARYTAVDFLLFDSAREPPPADIPKDCRKCDRHNERSDTVCCDCGEPLEMRDRYDVWTEALITTYTGDIYGVTLGAHYPDVIRWIPVMRPYPSGASLNTADFFNVVGAVTHVVYTLNDYGMHLLSPDWLPHEYQYLKTNLEEMMKRQDPELVGEFLDTLRSFGMSEANPLIRTGVEYLLSTQNADGSWGGTDVYGRYHATWTAVDGLRLYAWRGRRLNLDGQEKLLRDQGEKGQPEEGR